jgi:hypothetical protein
MEVKLQGGAAQRGAGHAHKVQRDGLESRNETGFEEVCVLDMLLLVPARQPGGHRTKKASNESLFMTSGGNCWAWKGRGCA